MKKYQNLKSAYKNGFRITSISFYISIEQYLFVLNRENKDSEIYVHIWTNKIPKYITNEYFKNKDIMQLIKINLQK